MNITELDSYNLQDAVKFNDQLNPAIWTGNKMKPEVRERLLVIAEDFKQSLGLSDLEVKDITVSGSNAGYTYTPHSDIDLHLVVDIPQADESDVYRELFDAKKYQYNDQHNITIGGYDVELYVEDARKQPVSQGIYSVLNNDWVKIPRKIRATVNDEAVKSKFEDIGHRIESAIASGNSSTIEELTKKIKNMRQAGLDEHGELGSENLAYKMLRNQGMIKKLYDARMAAQDAELSLNERRKKKAKKKKTKYGYGGYFYPGYGYGTSNDSADAGGGDGGGGESRYREDLDTDGIMMTKPSNMSSESVGDDATTTESTVEDFVNFCVDKLNIENNPKIRFKRDPAWSKRNKTFGSYNHDTNELIISLTNRHVMDILRTVAHELTHQRQGEVADMPEDAGETGSRWENEANAKAGVLMREYGQAHPELFAEEPVEEGIKQKLGALAAAACVAGTPGCATTQQGLKTVQDVGRTAQAIKSLNKDRIQAELDQELKNYLRAKSGQSGEGNLSRLYKLEKQVTKEASGYIPTKKQAHLPQFSNALSVDVRPGAVGKEANKLNLNTDSQGHPALLIKNLKNALESFKSTGSLLTEDEQLDEVKMSPSALRKFANSPEAEGIQAGFEAELIFRDTQADDDDGEMEYDMDYDERTSSIDEVVEFFMHDDFGNGLSDRGADRLREKLDNAYFEWRDDRVIRDFENESEDLVREVWLEERPMSERILSALTDGIGLDDEQADAVMELHKRYANKEIAGSEMSEEQLEMTSQYSEARSIANEVLDEEVEASIDLQDSIYDQALENFQENWEGDDSSFFSDIGLRWMSDVMNEYGLDWPYMTGGGGNGGRREWSEIAREIEQVTGMPVEVGYGYHTKKRVPNEYVLEPDSSLSPDDSEDFGLELVSPPMPLNKAIEQLEAIIDWANSDGDAYTNRSTGLHMGISIPFKGGDVDYLKLILFMGDQYVLEKFGRAANTYTESALKKIRQNVAGSKNRGDTKIASAMELMKNNLIELAQKYVQQGVGNSKYTSAHIKDGYIEFRSPGGDYLSIGDQGEQDALASTMRRFAYAMYLAGRPDLERPEYYKKLYKLIAPDGGEDLNLFARFSSGELTAEELKKQWAEKVINKEVPGGVGPKSEWKLYNRFTNKPVPGVVFSNYTEMDALERAKARVSPASSMMDFKQAYELRDVWTNTGRWSVIRGDNQETLEIIDAPTRGEAVDQAYEKYTNVIPFYVEPYSGGSQEPEPKLSRRAQLAKQIAQPKDYVIINKHSMLPFYTFRASSQSQAVDFAITYLQDKNLDIGNFTVQKASNVKQAIDNRVDSKQLQQRIEPRVRDIDFTIDQDRVQYEIVDRRTGQVVLRYNADSADDAGDKFTNWLRNQGMPETTENYGWRLAQTITEGVDDAQRARAAMDAAAKKLGYANFAPVPQSAKNTVMQMAVNALKLDSGHYNMLDRKNKQ